jgi:hypothetical protein
MQQRLTDATEPIDAAELKDAKETERFNRD